MFSVFLEDYLNLASAVSLDGRSGRGGASPTRHLFCAVSFSVCFSLRHVAVLIRRRLTPLDVLLVDEHLDALLDHADAGVEPGFGLVDDLPRHDPC